MTHVTKPKEADDKVAICEKGELPSDLVFSIEHNIPIPDELLRFEQHEDLKEAVREHLKDYIKAHYT